MLSRKYVSKCVGSRHTVNSEIMLLLMSEHIVINCTDFEIGAFDSAAVADLISVFTDTDTSHTN